LSNNKGIWFRVDFVDGCSVNLTADDETHAKIKVQNYHKGKIKLVSTIGGKSKPPWIKGAEQDGAVV